MFCFFCESDTHMSQYCDIYITDDSRREYAKTKNWCRFCLTELLEDDDDLRCVYCKFYRKCYICFSQRHHTAFCPHRENAPNFFGPSIVRDLFPRFIQMLNMEDKYLIAFMSPKAFNMLHLKRLTIVEKNIEIQPYMNSNFLIRTTFCLPNPIEPRAPFLPYLKKIIFKGKNIDIYNIKFASADLLLLLSSNIVYLNCSNVKFTPALKFSDVIKAAPNLEFIHLKQTFIDTGNSWPEEIFQWKTGPRLGRLEILLKTIDFNAKALATAIREKFVNGGEIKLEIFHDSNVAKTHNNTYHEFCKTMSSEFVRGKFSDGIGTVFVSFTSAPERFLLQPYFTLMK